MYKKTLPALLFFLVVCANGMGQLPDSIKAHIDSSLFVLEKHSLYGDKVDWGSVRAAVYIKAAGARNRAETFDALKIAFDATGDKHAAFYQYDDVYRLPNQALLDRYTDSIKYAWSKGPRIAQQLFGRIAYINVPFMQPQKQADIDTYANRIYEAVSALSKHDPRGWIIDLRLNGGGNIRPMLAGLAPFFKDGVVSYYIDRNGQATDEATFSKGDFTIDGVVQATINHKIASLVKTKVAVLIGAGTASSGEGVALVFSQRKRTKLFGAHSAGLANATNGVVFNNDQSYYLLSTAYIGDRKKRVLAETVKPDQAIDGNDAFHDLANDKVILAALRWLK